MQSGMARASLVLAVSLVSLGLAAPSAAWGASRYVSSSGADSGSCASPGAPCRSFGYAYRQASAGDVVELAAGSYGAQSIPSVAGRSAPAVELRASGGTVTVADLDINGDHVLVRGVRSSNEVSVTNARSVAVIDTHAFRVWMQNAHDVLFRGGSYGGNTNTPTVQIAGDPASSALTFDGVDFHDAVATNSTVHMECIWVAGVDGFTVRNSIFRNCAYFDIFFTRLNGPDPKNVLLENNVFEVTKQWNGQNAPYAVNVANWLSQAQNFHFRNNSFGGDIAIQPTTIANMRLSGNIGAVASCKSGVVYSHNVFTNAKCSASDKQVAAAMSQFADPAAHDWRLRPGAAAIDSADPADSPPTDRDGLGRNGPPDAGAHEYGGGGGPPPDGEAPSVPGSLAAVGGIEQVALSWAAASDNVAVTRYNVHRSTTSGFTPSRREPRGSGDRHRLHQHGAGARHLLLQADRRGRGREPERRVGAGLGGGVPRADAAVGVAVGTRRRRHARRRGDGLGECLGQPRRDRGALQARWGEPRRRGHQRALFGAVGHRSRVRGHAQPDRGGA